MADNNDANDMPKLSQLFDDIIEVYGYLDKTTEATNSNDVQVKVRKTLLSCEKAVNMINELQLFSNNEEIDEVATNEIRYMLLPAYLGYFTQLKCTKREDRINVVQQTKRFYTDFLKLCKSYNVTKTKLPDFNEDEEKEQTKTQMSRPPDLFSMGHARADKIQRFREKKILEEKLTKLYKEVNKEHVDDEVKREYYMSLLEKWIKTSLDELESINSELCILANMESMSLEPSPSQVKEKPKSNKAFHPFILTKDMIQKKVFGAGYPSLPTMTIEEFCQQKVDEGVLNIPGSSLQDRAADPEQAKKEEEEYDQAEEEKVEKDDPDNIRKQREWDDWKDDHRRGWGNRQNMG